MIRMDPDSPLGIDKIINEAIDAVTGNSGEFKSAFATPIDGGDMGASIARLFVAHFEVDGKEYLIQVTPVDLPDLAPAEPPPF